MAKPVNFQSAEACPANLFTGPGTMSHAVVPDGAPRNRACSRSHRLQFDGVPKTKRKGPGTMYHVMAYDGASGKIEKNRFTGWCLVVFAGHPARRRAMPL